MGICLLFGEHICLVLLDSGFSVRIGSCSGSMSIKIHQCGLMGVHIVGLSIAILGASVIKSIFCQFVIPEKEIISVVGNGGVVLEAFELTIVKT